MSFAEASADNEPVESSAARDELREAADTFGRRVSDKLKRASAEFDSPLSKPKANAGREATASHEPSALVLEQPEWLTRALDALPRDLPPPAVSPCADPSPVADIEALAAPGRQIVSCCENARDRPAVSEFGIGCRLRMACVYYVSSPSGWQRVTNRVELASVLGPPHSSSEALARVALVERSTLLGPDEYRSSPSRAPAQVSRRSTVEVVQSDNASFEVTIATSPYCGCDHPISLHGYRVSSSGLVTPTSSKVVLAREPWTCVD
jgi:hypothetical protein